ncbi:MAG: N-acetyl-gamma-glutamyl-phosphate reductase [Myxococcota bacterium]
MRVAIVGASGYTGLELVRIVTRHPHFELVAVTSEQRAGQLVGDSFPSLRGMVDQSFEANDPERLIGRIDFAFTALPHAASAPTVRILREAGIPVADLSADFRLRDAPTYARWYGDHATPELLGGAVYGLPELYREALLDAAFAAVPGCYPTSVLLPLVPFLRAGLVETSGILVDSKSGVSGAGRSADPKFLFAERDANCESYKVGYAHRHVPEMEQEASAAAGEAVQITFVPHLLPTTRGIVTTVFARPLEPLDAAAARAVLAEAYADETFVRVLPEGESPSLSSVRGSNFCDVAAFADERNGALILLSCLDNLVKGASGQAVQCANLMSGYPEEAGLGELALVP